MSQRDSGYERKEHDLYAFYLWDWRHDGAPTMAWGP